MMNGFLLHSDYWHGSLEFTPYDGSLGWSGFSEHAHVFSIEDARRLAATLPTAWKLRVLVDRRGREPQPIPANAQLPTKKGRAA